MNTVPIYMPYITISFMVCKNEDRLAVSSKDSENLAVIGYFAEIPTRDTVFTSEYSVRTAIKAVYTLLDIDRSFSEVLILFMIFVNYFVKCIT
nr:oleate hydratase [Limosilactobacillus agrestis]